MLSSMVTVSSVLLLIVSGCVARSPPYPKPPSPSPPAAPTPVAANAGLNPPIYNSWDLINVNTDPQVGPVAGTLGNR